jgi:hypothetical protein
MTNEVLCVLYALQNMKMSDGHAPHMFWTKDDISGYIPVNSHLSQSGTHDRTLDGFALGNGKTISRKCVAKSLTPFINSNFGINITSLFKMSGRGGRNNGRGGRGRGSANPGERGRG